MGNGEYFSVKYKKNAVPRKETAFCYYYLEINRFPRRPHSHPSREPRS